MKFFPWHTHDMADDKPFRQAGKRDDSNSHVSREHIQMEQRIVFTQSCTVKNKKCEIVCADSSTEGRDRRVLLVLGEC